jgi:hypothetical protein
VTIFSLVSAGVRRPQVVGSLGLVAGLALIAVTYGTPDGGSDQSLTQLAEATSRPTAGLATTTRATTNPPGAAQDAASGPGDDQVLGPPTTSAEDLMPDDGAPDPTSAQSQWQWQPSRPLPTDSAGAVVAQTTPAELVERQLPTLDTLPPPAGGQFTLTIEPLAGDPLARSTWHDGCPVNLDELRYLTASFWGFDDRPHQGELIVHAAEADRIGTVFETLYEARFPIEEMRIVTQAEVDGPPTGDGNNTASFVCREVTGGTRFSEHAYGLAIDVNPFQNPYLKGSVVLPELAEAYADRQQNRPGMILEGDVVVGAFDAAGWGWGGRWNSLKDYHHFALNNR